MCIRDRKVHVPCRVGHRKLHAGDDLDALPLARGARLRQSAEVVVVRDGDGGEAGAPGEEDEVRGRERAIRDDGVGVQVHASSHAPPEARRA